MQANCNISRITYSLKHHQIQGSAVTFEDCISLCHELQDESFHSCIIGTCGIAKRWIDTTQYEKRWIDTTHYSEGRRSLYTGVELCIRKLCNGMEGGELKSCAVTCSRRRRRGISGLIKRWVDPLSYGVNRV